MSQRNPLQDIGKSFGDLLEHFAPEGVVGVVV